ncbi:hypothetical protein ACFTSF_04465 [Kribbella sp. NPDC056951]|uniref:Type II secretion system protein GspF domain-containing protein n=1 Tax=Kribbella yunnanensis TaxID=190194 RepID=A0ABP4TL01_9ACTN
MGVVERAAIVEGHDEVVSAWKEIVWQASSMGLADRIVIGVKLRARAEALANWEGLARDAGDLATDARAFAAAVKAQNPLTTVLAVVGFAGGVLGFFGLWSFQALRKAWAPAAEAAEAGMAQTEAALIGFLTLASGGVIVAVIRAAVEAARAAMEALESFSARSHPSAVLLREVRPAEERLFAVFQKRVPEPPISAGPLIALGAAGLLVGIIFAALIGVGVAAR